MNGFNVTENWYERVVIVTPVGEIDILTAPELDEAVYTAFRKEPAALIVDLSKVTFLASAGMNLLMTLHRDVTRSAKFGVVADGSTAGRALKLTGIDSVLKVFLLLDSALAAFEDA